MLLFVNLDGFMREEMDGGNTMLEQVSISFLFEYFFSYSIYISFQFYYAIIVC
jgi:hypothetical protein